MDDLTLADTLRVRPWYLTHIYAAMKLFLAANLQEPYSPAQAQCEEILEKARKDYEAYGR